MKKNIYILCLLFQTNAFANDTFKIPESIQGEIPVGYKVAEQIFGDLNKDKQDDIVLVLKGLDKSKIVTNQYSKVLDRNRRGVLIAFKDEERYEVATLNPSCFSSENEDGGIYFAPELYINIKKGNLYLHYGHGRYGFWRYTFRHKDDDFKLIGYDSTQGGAVIKQVLSINFLTQKILTKKNINPSDEGGNEVYNEEWKNLSEPINIMLGKITDMDKLYIEKLIREQDEN